MAERLSEQGEETRPRGYFSCALHQKSQVSAQLGALATQSISSFSQF